MVPLKWERTGFLNGRGGTVLIGVTDEGKIVGQHVTDNTRKEIAREIKKIEPPIHLTISYVPISDDKDVIVLQAQEYDNAPYLYDHKSFLRNQSTTCGMSHFQLKEMFAKHGHHKHLWEDEITTDYKQKILIKTKFKRRLGKVLILSCFLLPQRIKQFLKSLNA